MMAPSRPLKVFFNAPTWLYRHRLGWIMGKRVVAVSHRGRTSGREYETVLEVAVFDKTTGESIVASAYGTGADWYRNIQAQPSHRIRTGRTEYVPHQRFLTADETRDAAARFCAEHPFEARMAPKVLPSIGAAVTPNTEPVDMLASLPMVAFRPAD